jgi:hypothetical protein
MKTLIAVDRSNRGDAVANEGVDAGNAIIVSEWDADAFHRRVSDISRSPIFLARMISASFGDLEIS